MRRLAILVSVLALGLVSSAGATVGKPSYRLDADSGFDAYAGETTWLKEHVQLIKAYGSFGWNHYTGLGIPVIDYIDISETPYAPLVEHTAGKGIEAVLAVEKEAKEHGEQGVFLDDVNWGTSFRDKQQETSFEPEAARMKKLLEEVRAAWTVGIIECNSQWHDISGRLKEAIVETEVAKCDLMTKEFGVGPTAGITTKADYEALLAFDDGLHEGFKGMVFTGDKNAPTSVEVMEYNVATELLATNGSDYVNGTKAESTPASFWAGFEVDLGEKLTEVPSRIKLASGAFVRYFAGGFVYVDPPGNGTVKLEWTSPGFKSVWKGSGLHSITLTERQGAVLTRE